MAQTLRTPLARLSYPALFEPKRNRFKPNDAPEYSVTLIFDARSKREANFMALMGALVQEAQAAAQEKHGNKWQQAKIGIRQGDEQTYLGKKGYGPGTQVIRAACDLQHPPGVIGRDRLPLTDRTKIYPGCYVNALLQPFAYNYEGRLGVSFGLRGVQFVEDAERLDDSVDVSSAFDALDAPADAPFDGGKAVGASVGAGSSMEQLLAMFR